MKRSISKILLIVFCIVWTQLTHSVATKFDSIYNSANLNIETSYDSQERPVRIVKRNQMGEIVGHQEIQWDENNRKIKEIYWIDDQRSISTTWVYNTGGKLIEVIEGAETESPISIQYLYDEKERISQIQKGDGTKLYYEYNQIGELERLHSSDLSVDYVYSYDEQHNLIHIKDQVLNNETKRTFSSAGNLLQEIQGNGLFTLRKYNSLNQLTQLILPDQSSIEYSYEDNYLYQIKRKTKNAEEYSHSYVERNSLGQVLREKMAGDLGERISSYNPEAYLEDRTTPFWSTSIVYDLKTNQIKFLSLQNPLEQSTKEYLYDERCQLIHELSNDDMDSFAYDWIGNRTAYNEKAYYFNDLLQLVDGNNSYDTNGNLIKTSRNGHPIYLRYDALDRLIELRSNELTYQYVYDAFHRRLAKICIQSDGTIISEKIYLYNGLNEIGAFEKNTLIELRILGEGLVGEVGSAIAMEIGQKIYIPIHDHRGSVCCLVDLKTKEIIETISYNAFGEEFSENPISPWRFSSKRLDEESGFTFFGKRYYNPSWGRWITPDPFGCIEGPNSYIYASNDPINRIDPYGLFSLSALWHSLCSSASSFKTQVFDLFETVNSFIQEHLSFEYNFRDNVEDTLVAIFGKIPLGFYGFYQDVQEIVVIGEKEFSEKARITFINGILNAHHDVVDTVETISKYHEGNNIYYVFKSTEGWTKDLLKSALVKFGWVSPEAKQLAELWKELIAEMGGVESGGIIIHYAHSIGGSDTGRARTLLSPEEQKMIKVYTMGSPTLLKSDGFLSVVNYVSLGDGVCYLDPISYHKARNDPSSNVVFLDNSSSIPGIDHPLSAYTRVLEVLGRQFLETYAR